MKLPKFAQGRDLTIFADQVTASASNALAVFAAGRFLATAEMNTYALWQLAATTLLALQRGVISQPSMALTDKTHRADPSAIFLTRMLLPITVAAALLVLGVGGSPLLVVAAASVSLTLVQDLLRFRAFALGAARNALVSDVAYLVLLGVAVLLWPPHDATTMLLVWAVPAGLASIPLLVKGDDRLPVAFSRVFELGRYQAADWGISTITSTVPMFIIDRLVPLSSVGAFRLAQTITGPLNTISTFVEVKFLVDAHTFQTEPRSAVMAKLRKAVIALVGVNVAYGVVAFVGWFLIRDFFQPALIGQLMYALPLTLLSTAISAPAAVYLAVTKATRMQRYAIAPRLVILIVSLLAMGAALVAYQFVKLDPLVVMTVVTPIVTTAAWYRAIRRVLGDFYGPSGEPPAHAVRA